MVPQPAAAAGYGTIRANDENGFLVGQPRRAAGSRQIPAGILPRRMRDSIRVVHLPNNHHKAGLLWNLHGVARTKLDVVRRPREILLALPDMNDQAPGNGCPAQGFENSLPLLRRGLV